MSEPQADVTTPPDDTYAQDIITRIGEFVDPGVPWQRALWMPSTVLALRELIEHGESLELKAIKVDQVKDSAALAQALIEKDAGIGPGAILDALQAILAAPSELAKESQRHRLARLIERVDADYLDRWEQAVVAVNASRPGAERVARYLTSYLLDSDVGADQIASMLPSPANDLSQLAGVCAASKALLSQPATKMVVIIPLHRAPELFSSSRTTASRQVAVLRDRNSLDNAHPMSWPEGLNAGLELSVKARDPWAAVAHARELLARLGARLAVSKLTEALLTHDKVAVRGYTDLFSLDDGRGSVRIPALDRSAKTLQIAGYAEADALDDALELISSLGGGTSGAALTNGWAAIEGLLVGVTESGLLAAERFADLIVADWPRSELTWLANAPNRDDLTDPDLHAVLADKGRGTLQMRIDALHVAFRQQTPLAYKKPRDIAALHRLERLYADAADTLAEVRDGVLQALRRLYVQRNLVMHAGSFRSVARANTLRTVPTLAAAGMDRLVRAAGEGVTPLMLAARAKVELDLISSGTITRPLDKLLE